MKKMTANRIISIDPGDHIGIVYCTYSIDNPMSVKGTTFEGSDRNMKLWDLLNDFKPDVIIFEQFALRPGMATKLAGNKFITCEVIGVIKYVCTELNIPIVEQAPSVKKYFGGFKSDWEQVKQTPGFKLTEHVKDAYQHLKYFERNGLKKFE